MRDALSLLDQCTGHGDTIDAELVCSVAGMTGKDHLFSLASAVNEKNSAIALELISDLHGKSCDMERLCSDMINHFRNLMIVKTVRSAESLLVCTADELQQYKDQSSKFTLENILCCISLLQETMSNIKRGVNRRTEMEMTFIKLSTPSLTADNESLLRRIADLENKMKGGAFVSAPAVSQTPAEAEEKRKEVSQTIQPVPSASEPTAAKAAHAPQSPQEDIPFPEEETQVSEAELPWAEILQELTKLNMPLWGVLNGSSAVIQGDFVLIKSDNPTLSAFIKTGTNARDIKSAIKNIMGRAYRLGLYNASAQQSAPTPAQPKKDPLENLIDKARDMGINVDVNK